MHGKAAYSAQKHAANHAYNRVNHLCFLATGLLVLFVRSSFCEFLRLLARLHVDTCLLGMFFLELCNETALYPAL